MDGEGLKPEALDAACRTTSRKRALLHAALQNPTSAVMSERRRRQIAAIAEKYRLTVIEDDTYGFLSPERRPLAPSDSTADGLRHQPVEEPVPRDAARVRRCAARHPGADHASRVGDDDHDVARSALICLSGWIEDGTAARIADWKRHEGAARQAMAKRVLTGQRYQTHPCSPHIWLTLPMRWSSEGFVAQARSRGVVAQRRRLSSRSARSSREPCVCVSVRRERAAASSRRWHASTNAWRTARRPRAQLCDGVRPHHDFTCEIA